MFFTQSLPLYAKWLFSMLLSGYFVGIKKPDRISSPTFAADEF